MRTMLFAGTAIVALVAAGPATADFPHRPVPGPVRPLPPPPGAYPGWPRYPGPWPPPYPPTRPRPPAVGIQYTVHYRPAPAAPWRVYARYASHDRAARAAARLERRGYQTDVVVTYRR